MGGRRTSKRGGLAESKRLMPAAAGSVPRTVGLAAAGLVSRIQADPFQLTTSVGAPAVGSSSHPASGSPRSFANSAAARATAASGAGLGIETRRPALAGTTQRSSVRTSPGLTAPWPTTRAIEPLRPSEEAISTVTRGLLTVLRRHLGRSEEHTSELQSLRHLV